MVQYQLMMNKYLEINEILKIILSTDYILEMKMPNLSKMLTLQNLLILLVVVILAYALYSYSNGKKLGLEGNEDGTLEQPTANEPAPEVPNGNGAAYTSHQVANASELLPNDVNSQFGEFNTISKNNVAMPDLLEAGHHMGMVSTVNKIPNTQLRANPPVAKQPNLTPFNNPTTEPDNFGLQ